MFFFYSQILPVDPQIDVDISLRYPCASYFSALSFCHSLGLLRWISFVVFIMGLSRTPPSSHQASVSPPPLVGGYFVDSTHSSVHGSYSVTSHRPLNPIDPLDTLTDSFVVHLLQARLHAVQHSASHGPSISITFTPFPSPPFLSLVLSLLTVLLLSAVLTSLA